MDKDELDRRARALGLERLAGDHAAALERALENGTVMASRMPADLHWTEEPAHIFSLAPRKEKRS